jgi:hypothetical protein
MEKLEYKLKGKDFLPIFGPGNYLTRLGNFRREVGHEEYAKIVDSEPLRNLEVLAIYNAAFIIATSKIIEKILT